MLKFLSGDKYLPFVLQDYCSSKGSRGSRLGATASATSSAAAAVAAPFLSPTWESPPHIPASPPHQRGKVALVRSYRKDDWIVIDIKEVALPRGSSRRRASCVSCCSIGSSEQRLRA